MAAGTRVISSSRPGTKSAVVTDGNGAYVLPTTSVSSSTSSSGGGPKFSGRFI